MRNTLAWRRRRTALQLRIGNRLNGARGHGARQVVTAMRRVGTRTQSTGVKPWDAVVRIGYRTPGLGPAARIPPLRCERELRATEQPAKMHTITKERGIVGVIAFARETVLVQQIVDELVLGNADPRGPLREQDERRVVES